MVKDQYKYGREKELKLARSLRAKGASVKVSRGSKGAADLKATFSTGRKWNIQVKATRKGTAASPSAKDLGRLKQSATKSKATPVVAKVSRGRVSFSSARSGRKLTPSTRKSK
ncbi:unnamed protein product [marine sediment metagenome]|uniref:Restriction endonuclease type IV Mrr domain-containing protein n=1 Tax=marine sediment metagenome TaxID=412755 RepID=X0UYN7_9ZZZZ